MEIAAGEFPEFLLRQGGEVQTTQPLYRRTIRILVVDSSPITSQLLAGAIGRHRGIEILGFGSELEEVLSLGLNHTPDLALISARIGEDPSSGFYLLQKLRSEWPDLKAVILLDSQNSDTVVRAFRSGASGVFGKNQAINILCKCIRAVHEGQVWANSQELGYVLTALTAAPRSPMKGKLAFLSNREQQVVHSLADGLTNRQIGDRLKISPHTVKNYMFKIFEKLGVSSRVELISLVLSHDGGQSDSKVFGFQSKRKHSAEEPQSKPAESIVQVPRRLPQYEVQSEKDRSSISRTVNGLG